MGTLTYLTNDDTGIQNTLCGTYTGTPYYMNPYVKVAVTYPLSRLYMLVPTIQWWFVYSHALLSLGMVVINTSLLRQVDELESRRPIAYALVLALNLGLFLHVVDSVSFTAIPVVLCSAVACCFATAERRLGAGRLVLLAALLLLAYCHRASSFYASVPFAALALAHYAYRHRSHGRSTLASCAGFALAMLAVVLVANAATLSIRAQIDGQDFLDFNEARANYLDYKHDTYEGNPELYDSVGWDKTLYGLVQKWFFLDDRVNTDSLNLLAKNSEARAQSSDASEIATRLSSLMRDQESPLALCLMACFCLLALLATWHHRLDVLFVAGLALAALALLIYQLVAGRILYRTIITTIIPAVVLFCATLLPRLHDVGRSTSSQWACCVASSVALLLTAGVCLTLLNPTRIQTIRSTCERGDSTASYAALHRNNVYVRGTDVPLTLNPRPTFAEGQPYNLIGWNLPSTPSSTFALQLQKNGLRHLGGEQFAQQNVYFVTSTSPDDMDKSGSNKPGTIFYSWLKDNYGATACELADTICDGVYVYRFAFGRD